MWKTQVCQIAFLFATFFPTTGLAQDWQSRQEGNNLVFSPGDLRQNEVYSITITPPEPLDGEFSTWFSSRVRTPNDGKALSTGAVDRKSERMLVQSVMLQSTTGGKLLRVYTGIHRPDGQVQLCYVTSSPSTELIRRYVQPTAALIAKNTLGATPSQDAPTKVAPSKPPKKEEPSIAVAAPGTGVRPEQIEALLYSGQGMYLAMGYQYVEKVHLLLRDGTVYNDLKIPPEDLDVALARQVYPDKFTHWRKEAGHYLVEKNGQWTKLNATAVTPAEPGSGHIKNLVHQTAYSMGGLGGSVFTYRLKLMPDGRFERSSGAQHATGAMQSTAGFASSATSVSDKTGTQSVAGGGNGNVYAYSQSKSMDGAADKVGTYRVTGYTLELKCASGRVERLLTFYPFRDHDKLYVAGATYDPPDDNRSRKK